MPTRQHVQTHCRRSQLLLARYRISVSNSPCGSRCRLSLSLRSRHVRGFDILPNLSASRPNRALSPSTARLRASAQIVAKLEQTVADGVSLHEVEQHHPGLLAALAVALYRAERPLRGLYQLPGVGRGHGPDLATQAARQRKGGDYNAPTYW
jgi:hypothetical protein